MTTDVVAKLWGFCHTLRHDGIGYSHYVEQLTYLLFLKMAGERGIELPQKSDWTFLRSLSGTDLLDAYVEALRLLGRQGGILADIFSSAQSRFSNPVNLKKLIGLIDETDWTSLDVDVKAAAFEGLLEKAASEGKKGAGQYFTPRLLIKAIVRCMKPDPRANREFKINDPACGTGGFLVASYEWLLQETKGSLDRDVARRIRTQTYYGQDIDPEPRRLAVMNLYLHQVEPHIERKDSISETPNADRHDVVLTNPPFGSKGANEAPNRDDFTVSTSNKQLNFLQHVLTVLRPGGRAAVIVPDNVLFADQAGEVFQVLMEDCDLHTVLRLPGGTFSPYSEGTKTNVIFFTKGRSTGETWIYDARANVPNITKKDRPLTAAHFAEFERCYGDDPNGRSKRSDKDSSDGRWRRFTIDQIKARHYKLHAFKWIRDDELDDPDNLPEPEELITEAAEELRLALDDLDDMQRLMASDGEADLVDGTSILRADLTNHPEIATLVDTFGQKRGSSAGHLAAARHSVERLRRAVLAAATSGRLTAEWREHHRDAATPSPDLAPSEGSVSASRQQAIAEFDDAAFAELPDSWIWVPLAAVADGVLGKMLDRVKNKGIPRPYLRNINVRWRGFDFHDVQEMRFAPGEEERYGLRPGDVLVCEGGEPGRAAVWLEQNSDIRIQKALHRVRPEKQLLPEWLVDVLQAHTYSGLLSDYFTGTGISHLTGVSLAKVPIPLPPLAEQAEIVRRVSQLFRLSEDVTT